MIKSDKHLHEAVNFLSLKLFKIKKILNYLELQSLGGELR